MDNPVPIWENFADEVVPVLIWPPPVVEPST